MIDLEKAYEYLEKKGCPQDFYEIWNHFTKGIKMTDNQKSEEMTKFYFNFINDRRFVTVGRNNWDIKRNQPFDEFQHNVSSVYDESDLFHDDETDINEEDSYKKEEALNDDGDLPITLDTEKLGEESLVKDINLNKAADANEEVYLDDILIDETMSEMETSETTEIILDVDENSDE